MPRKFCADHGLDGEIDALRRHGFGMKFSSGSGPANPARQARLFRTVALRHAIQNAQIRQQCGLLLSRTLNECRNHSIPAGLAVMLCAGLVVEFTATGNTPRARAPVLPGFEAGASTPSMPIMFPTTVDAKGWATTILARPLLTRNRSAISAIQAVIPAPLPRLTGIMISADGKIGIFSGTNGSSIIVKEGDHFGVFEVLSITADSVHVSGPAGITRLLIQYQTGAQPRTTPVVTADNTEDFPGSNAWPSQLK